MKLPAVHLNACALLVALTALPLAADEQLIVYPPQIVVRPDYPVQLVVLRATDSQVIDVTRQAKITPLDTASLTVDTNGLVQRVDKLEANRTCQLHVQMDELETSVTAEVIGGEILSPIFPREVAAVLGKAGCNLGTCHGNLHGKAGFRLSLRGDDPALDFASITRGQAGRLINRLSAEESLLMRKPLGLLAHQGGVRFAEDSREAIILRRWIKDGCQWNAQQNILLPDTAPSNSPDENLQSLEVYPARALIAKNCDDIQLSVVAIFADGARRDVTSLARFEPSIPANIAVSASGLVSAEQPMDVSISVSYLSGRAASRLTFLAHESSARPQIMAESRVDQLIDQHLRSLQVDALPIADDFVFVRRAHLAIAGRLPNADEVRQFCIDDQSVEKRQRLVERLLHEPGYAWLWSLRWSDLLRNEQKVMSDQGAAAWHQWMTDQVSCDRPLNEFVSEMLTTLGSTYEHPPASFHRTHRDPETAAESIGQVFLGVRLQCARCHNHPFDKWRQDDYYGLAAYFTTLERKQVNNDPKDKFDKHIISGDEVISLKEDTASIWHPGRATNVSPKPLTARFDAQPESDANAKPLDALANWLTTDNRLFARNMANRIWYHYMGVGIVDPPDDFRDSNPASNPELLEYLTDELITSGYSTRHVARLILTSQAFARESIAEPDASSPLGGARVFSGYPLRRLGAETLLDAISSVTEVYPAKATTRADALAVAKVNVPVKADFLTTFGKPGRLLVCECERSSEVSLGQSLVLVNGTETREKLAAQENVLGRLLASGVGTKAQIEELYLTALARMPRQQELLHFTDYVETAPSRRTALEDVLWALMNSKEFSLMR